MTLDGSGSGGPWGTNVTYSWALTDPASGVTVTFDNKTSATTVVTIPALADGTELTFTLTVTGRGHESNGTATATVTVNREADTDPTAPTLTSASVGRSGGSTTLRFSEDLDLTVGEASLCGGSRRLLAHRQRRRARYR